MGNARAWTAVLLLAVVLSTPASGCSNEQTRPQPELARAEGGARSKPKPSLSAASDVERVHVPVTGAEPHLGPADALVTLVLFADFECPFCSRAEPTLTALRQAYGSRLRVVFRHLPLPFHAQAKESAEAAMEAFEQGRDEKFWAMHDKLLANQKALSRAHLEHYARELGLDLARFRTALDSHRHLPAVEADAELGMRLGAIGTPVFFINGRPLQGALPLSVFKAVISDELERAERMLATGVARSELYGKFVEHGQRSARFEPARPRPSPFESTVYNVPVSEHDPQRGATDGLVTVVLFGDFECEYTERALATLAELEKKYAGDLRLVWKHRPMNFHDHAHSAATLALEAFAQGGSELFWQASELLFRNRTALDRASLESYGPQLGLSAEQTRTALDSDRYKAKIDEDKALSMRIAFAPTTPAFAINGRYLRGAQSREIFELLIDEELAKAKAQLASGTPRARVYDELTRDGAMAPIEIAPGTLAADAKKVHDIAIPKRAAKRGAPEPLVVIQEFGDFQCPFCRQVQGTLRQLLAQNPDSLRVVWRNYPLPNHQHARLAAEAAQEVLMQAGDEKFWVYHDRLLDSQALTRADLERQAQDLGIDMVRFREALERHHHRSAIDADLLAVEAIGERVGTPAFLVNGLLIAGAQPIEVFNVAVQRALLRRAASASATSRAAR